MARVVGSGSVGVYRQLWAYSQLRPNLGRMPITIRRPGPSPPLPLQHPLRFAHLNHTYHRPWDYLVRRYARLPITILRPKAQLLRRPQAYQFANLQDTYRRLFDYAAHAIARRRMPITVATSLGTDIGRLRPRIIRQDVYIRAFDYAVHQAARRRKPITITRPSTYAVNLPHAHRYAYLEKLFNRPHNYVRYYLRRAAPTFLRPKAPSLPLPNALRFTHLRDTYYRPWDYATHRVNRRRMPLTITVATIGKNLPLQLPHAQRFAHLHDNVRPWDYLPRRYTRIPITITAPVVTAACDLLIELSQVLVNEELVLNAADTTKGGHGAGAYVTDPDCYVRKY